MDTRWKSMIKSLPERLKTHRSSLAGLPFVIAGIAMITYLLYTQYLYRPTREVLLAGLLINVLIGTGLSLIYTDVIHSSYIPVDGAASEPFDQWKSQWKRNQKVLLITGGVLLAMALFNFNSMLTGYRYYYSNYSMGYMLIATVVIQFALCQYLCVRFYHGRLHEVVDKASQISRQRLKEAVELEKKSLEKAARSEQLKVDLISNVSHDLKTPLTSMVGYLELLKKEQLSPAARDYADVISDKAEKLKTMIESLFSLAKASSGNISLTIESVELNMLIQQLFADMDDKIRGSGLEMVVSLTKEDTHFKTDNLHMYRICQNLLENALKYSAKDTRVFIKTYIKQTPSARKLCLEMTNTAGYHMDFGKDDIVERFARGDKARTTDGNGLGLAIVSTYTGALGGAFDIKIDCDQFKASLEFQTDKNDLASGCGTEAQDVL